MSNNAPLRIAMLAPFGIRPKGTLLARMLPLAQALTRQGHIIEIIAPSVLNPEDAGSFVEYDGVRIFHTQTSKLPSPLYDVSQVIQLTQRTLAFKPDVVHIFKPKGYAGLSGLYLKFLHPKLPLIIDTDDWEGWGGWNDLLPYPWFAKQVFAWQERDLPRRANAVTVVSQTLETQIWGFGVDPKQVFYVPNGLANVSAYVEKSQARKTLGFTDQPIVLLYTRFWEFDLLELVETLVLLNNQMPNVRALVIGKGERGEEKELLRLAEHFGFANILDYRGWVQPNDIPIFLSAADVALMPMNDTLINRARGLAKLLELMTARLPIVASRVGQVVEYLDNGTCGVLVQAHNPVAFAKAVVDLLEQAEKRQNLGEAASRRVREMYNWDRLASIALQAYISSVNI